MSSYPFRLVTYEFPTILVTSFINEDGSFTVQTTQKSDGSVTTQTFADRSAYIGFISSLDFTTLITAY